MIKKYGFYIALLFLYILFLCKDQIFKLGNNVENLSKVICEQKEKNYQEEYEKLSAFYQLEPISNQVVYARLLNRNMYEFYEFLTIHKGSDQGIKEGALVVSDQGVLGIIDKVNKNSSKVMLLTHSKINLSVKIGDAYGILSCKDHQVVVKNVKTDAEVKENDLVYTSGLTSIPANFLIGTVESIQKDSLELEYILNIKLASDLDHVLYVGVLT